MTDRLIRGLLPQCNFRFALCQGKALCNEALTRHRADWLSGWLLGEALVCATLLGVVLKKGEKLTLRWGYPGPAGTILADTSHLGEVRGFVQRLSLMDEVANLEQALGGQGQISAITSTTNKVVHTGITEGVFKDLPRDMAHLLSVSYQVETLLVAGLVMPPRHPVQVRSALGVMIQPMPGAELHVMETLRGIAEGGAFQVWLEDGHRTLEDIQAYLAPHTGPWKPLQETQPVFRCTCSREKVEAVLRMYDPAELQDMLEQQGQAVANCHFCGETYLFHRGELQSLLRQSQTGSA